MKKIIEKRPVITTICLFFVGVLLAGILMALAQARSIYPGVVSGLSRIVVGCIFFVLFKGCFNLKKSFKGLILLLPAFLFALYKIPYFYVTGGSELTPLSQAAVIMGTAPAIFEEVIFRGILIYGLKKKNLSPMRIVMTSALIFALCHFTNFLGMPFISMVIQVLFAFSVGIVFGAVYLDTEDLISVMICHMLIDTLGQVFVGGNTSSYLVLVLFVILLIAEIMYGIFITGKISSER